MNKINLNDYVDRKVKITLYGGGKYKGTLKRFYGGYSDVLGTMFYFAVQDENGTLTRLPHTQVKEIKAL